MRADWDRNAASRKDGYWPFIAKKEEPPQSLTYGEYPLPFFLELVEKAARYAGLEEDYSQACMADLGSGTGRLVLWAAINQRWKSCLGVELLPDLHRVATEQLALARASECAELIRADDVVYENASWDDAALGATRPPRDRQAMNVTAVSAAQAPRKRRASAAQAPRDGRTQGTSTWSSRTRRAFRTWCATATACSTS